MPVLVYSPGVEVFIDSRRRGVIDVTEDLANGRMELVENRAHSFSFSVLNRARKYDGLFMPNDRIVVRMKRLRWLPVFAGYLNSVPLFSVYPRTVRLEATCTLKRLQFHSWDPSTLESEHLLHDDDDASRQDVDGGMKGKALRLLTEVAGWPSDHIHIAEVPDAWFARVSDLYDVLGDRIGTHQAAVGSGATIAGTAVTFGPNQVEGVNNLTGMLPTTSGRLSKFGGPSGGAYGAMALTGESGRTPRDNFYCAMRWPYQHDNGLNSGIQFTLDGTTSEVAAAKAWWANRKILITNPANGRQCVVRAADWGPATWTNYAIDTAPYVHEVLGAKQGDMVNIGFAPSNAPLGLYSTAPSFSSVIGEGVFPLSGSETLAGKQSLPSPKPAGTKNLDANDFAWGGYSNGRIPANALSTVLSPSGSKARLHPLAAAAYERMRDAALREGVSIDPTSSYRSYDEQAATKAAKGDQAASAGSSNHGWGFALDLNVGDYTTATYSWLKTNGSKFGWVNPPWAVKGGSNPEPWHWEFWGGVGLTSLPDDLAPLVAGAESDPLFNSGGWAESISPGALEASLLAGPRALMNDEPFLKTLDMLFGASMRSYCTAPNGDLIAWFPDYFGQYGTAGKIVVEEIELMDFTVGWTDLFLKTHMFTSGSSTGFSAGLTPGGEDATAIWQKYGTTGIATIEFPEIMRALFGVTEGNDPYDFLNAAAFLQKHGARPDYQPMSTISNPAAVFWYALFLFQKNWAEQFSTSIPTTWMPEAFPGMLVQIPTIAGQEVNFQAYIQSVVHTFDFRDGAGFDTQITVVAPSIVDGGSSIPLVLRSR